MKVLELLRAHTNKIPPDASLQAVVDILDLYQVLLIPVVDDDDHLLGVVYEDQVTQAVLGGVWDSLRNSSVPKSALPTTSDITAQDIMLPAVAVDEHDDARAALAKMAQNGLSRLPVTGSGRVIGTVSRVDICQAILAGEVESL